jgi:hypothetical protein
MTLCSLVGGYQSFGGTSCLYLRGRYNFYQTTRFRNPVDHNLGVISSWFEEILVMPYTVAEWVKLRKTFQMQEKKSYCVLVGCISCGRKLYGYDVIWRVVTWCRVLSANGPVDWVLGTLFRLHMLHGIDWLTINGFTVDSATLATRDAQYSKQVDTGLKFNIFNFVISFTRYVMIILLWLGVPEL